MIGGTHIKLAVYLASRLRMDVMRDKSLRWVAHSPHERFRAARINHWGRVSLEHTVRGGVKEHIPLFCNHEPASRSKRRATYV